MSEQKTNIIDVPEVEENEDKKELCENIQTQKRIRACYSNMTQEEIKEHKRKLRNIRKNKYYSTHSEHLRKYQNDKYQQNKAAILEKKKEKYREWRKNNPPKKRGRKRKYPIMEPN